ncbi:MAG: nucleoid-associated protein, YbaB/EbfC family [Gammaproteobacteria bacterium RIFCSPHIGHO2_12_FULL_42_10]|nr:MAG: nucleoid-associated protein, YbaB/EbfC family [Gammaproteobacteria bacterium RIFCSPHIGHO2_12_FULL_42_10]
MNKSASENNLGLNEIMKRAQEMQKKLQDIQKQVSEMTVVGRVPGKIEFTVTGQHYIKKVMILDPNLLREDNAVIGDILAAAINDATNKIEKHLKEKMGGLSGLPSGLEETEKQ